MPATFKMAFAGKTSQLAETIDISTTGLLAKLVDKNVISRQQRELVEVNCIIFRVIFTMSLRCYQTVACPVLSVCDVRALWPNG